MYSLQIATGLAFAIALPVMACDPPSSAPHQVQAIVTVAPRINTFVATPVRFAFVSPDVVSATSSGDDSDTNINIVSNDNGQKVEITIHNDDISAKVNGVDVPADRIHRDDHGITIVDEKGAEIYSTSIATMHDGIGNGAFVVGQGMDDGVFGNLYSNWTGDAAFNVEPPKVMLGVHMESPGPALAKQLHFDAESATLIAGVYEKLAANTAGIQEYDVITSIDGSDKADPASIREVLSKKEPGDKVEMDIIQAGEHKHVTITLDKYDAKRMNEATLLGSTGNDLQTFGGNGTNWIFDTRKDPDGKIMGLAINPGRLKQWQLQQAPLAALGNNAGLMRFDQKAMREQMEELQAQIEEMRSMMKQMMPVPAQPAQPKEAPAKPLGPNES